MSRVLIVTGMHRSGTSLVANYLARSGLDMGDELLPADHGNPRGYFEDVAIHDLHRELMWNAGIADAFTVEHSQLPIPVDDAFVDRAKAIVAARDDRPQWGWKEPRTALFCDLWAELLPDATFLFVFREPRAVLDSLLRRATNEPVNARPVVGLELWRLYNEAMFRFHESHPERCLWWEADALIQDAGLLIHALSRFGFELDKPPIEEILDASAYHRDVRGRARMVTLRNRAEARRCMQLFDRLRELAVSRSVAMPR